MGKRDSNSASSWFLKLCEKHVESQIDRARSMGAFRLREIEDAWRSLLLPLRWRPTFEMITRLAVKAKERGLPMTDRWVEPTGTGVTIIVTVSHAESAEVILGSLCPAVSATANRYAHFIRAERRRLRSLSNWTIRDMAHWVFTLGNEDFTADLLYWVNLKLMLEIYGMTLERQSTGQQPGPIEFAYPGSIQTPTEFASLYNALLQEEVNLMGRGEEANLTGREVRVFVSSTFRDMQRERELLVKQVFPELRHVCTQRSVGFTEVDLRWGITEEQAAEGKVLPICLEEIRLSRPYFICLLGERYGWIPQSVPDTLLEKEPWLREHVARRTSVTELEILHGVLNDPAMAGHAYFYFRDPRYLTTLPEAACLEMSESDDPNDVRVLGRAEARRRTDERKAKLAALKQLIRGTGLPLLENYASPEALATAVREDLLALINQLYPPNLTLGPLEQETLSHDSYAARKLIAYVPRPTHTAALDAFVGSEPTGRGIVLTGDSGAGKTTLLGDWARRWRQSHDGFVFTHYFGSTPDSASVPQFLQRLLAELKRTFEIEDEIPTDPDALRLALGRWLSKIGSKGQIVLILDALNQIEGEERDRCLVWLPRILPPNVRALTSALPGPALDALRDREWTEHRLPLPDVSERRQMIEAFLRHYGKEMDTGLRDQLAASANCANPLFLRSVLEELRQFGSFEKLSSKVSEYLAAATPDELLGQVIRRWKEDFDLDRELVGRSLGLLWAARQGLSEVEWLELLGKPDEPLARQLWSPLFLAVEPHLTNRAGVYTFGHDFLRRAVEAEFVADAEARESAHLALADYFSEKSVCPRKVVEYLWQLKKAEAWDALIEQVHNAELVQGTWRANPYDLTSTCAALESAKPGSLARAFDFILDNPSAYVWLAGKSSVVADYLLTLAETFWSCGYLDGCFKMAGAVLEHFKDEDVETLWRAAAAQCRLFIERRSEGDLQAAWNLASTFRRLADSPEHIRVRCAIMSVQETILLDWNQTDEALTIIEEHKRLSRANGDESNIAASLGSEAVALYEEGKLSDALRAHREEERIYRKLGDQDGLQVCLGNQATVMVRLGLHEDALVVLKEQERICSEIGKMTSLANCYSNQAFAHAMKGRRDQAQQLLQKQEELARRMGSEKQLRIALEAKKALEEM